MSDKNEAEAATVTRWTAPPTVSADTAARILRISRSAVLRLIAKARVGGRSGQHRIYFASVMDYAEKRKASGGPSVG